MGLAWWAGACAGEIDQFLAARASGGTLLVASATFFALERAAAALDWLPGRLLALVAIPTAFVALPIALGHEPHLFAGWRRPAWALLLACIYEVLRRLERVPHVAWGHAPALWLVALVLAFGLAGGARSRGSRCTATGRCSRSRSDPRRHCSAANALHDRGIGPFARHAAVHLRAAAPRSPDSPSSTSSAIHFRRARRRRPAAVSPDRRPGRHSTAAAVRRARRHLAAPAQRRGRRCSAATGTSGRSAPRSRRSRSSAEWRARAQRGAVGGRAFDFDCALGRDTVPVRALDHLDARRARSDGAVHAARLARAVDRAPRRCSVSRS
jgi:hypothetical protein